MVPLLIRVTASVGLMVCASNGASDVSDGMERLGAIEELRSYFGASRSGNRELGNLERKTAIQGSAAGFAVVFVGWLWWPRRTRASTQAESAAQTQAR